MCGIAGVVKLNGDLLPNCCLSNISDKMKHRGPDSEGIWIGNNVSLIHTRLSIIDLETGDQPMANEDGSVRVVLNGEIYNFKELRKNLEAEGHIFKTASDTEVLVHGYEEWGKDMIPRLNGMFAFGLWSVRDNTFLLVRDRLGVKPLYYYLSQNVLVFASELQALMASDLVPSEIDMEALELYLHYQYVPSPYSIYKEVKKLPPGKYLEMMPQEKKWNLKTYWDINVNCEPDISKNFNSELERLEELIDDAVKIRLYCDVPFGVFLSGGTDSGLMTALMSKNLNQPVKTFSIGIEGSKNDELKYAAIVAKKFNTDHEELKVNFKGLDLIPKVCPNFGEPFADSSAIPTYLVSKMAAEKVKMVLSGDGGDEIFGGYISYNYFLTKRNYHPLLRNIIKNASRLCPNKYIASELFYVGSNWEQRHDLWMSCFTHVERKRLLEKDFRLSETGYHANIYSLNSKDTILNAQYLDLKTYLPDDILVKVDRMSMANSIEVRSPLLDYRIVEYAFSLPTEMKIRNPSKKGIYGKYILKELASKYLGKQYVYRPKQGFSIPIDKWLKEDDTGYLNDTLLSTNSSIFSYVNRKFVHEIINEHLSGRSNHGAKIWNLLMFDGWLRHVYPDQKAKV